MFKQRHNVFAYSDQRPLGDKKPIGTAATALGAKRVYWTWEVENFQQGQRYYPRSMLLKPDGWHLGEAIRK